MMEWAGRFDVGGHGSMRGGTSMLGEDGMFGWFGEDLAVLEPGF